MLIYEYTIVHMQFVKYLKNTTKIIVKVIVNCYHNSYKT